MEELHGPGEDGADDERAGLGVPAVPEGGEQARLDVGLSCSRLRHSGQSHWSSCYITVLLLVESFRVVEYFPSDVTP